LTNIIIAAWFFENTTKLDESIVESKAAITPPMTSHKRIILIKKMN